MDLPDGGAEVPFGAILAALKMIEGGSEGGEPTAVSEEVAALLDVWGIPVITQAFGLLIYGARRQSAQGRMLPTACTWWFPPCSPGSALLNQRGPSCRQWPAC